MAAPAVVECAADTWQLVADAVSEGQIWPNVIGPHYLYTYVMDGEAAPTGADDPKAHALMDHAFISAKDGDSIDVYVKAVGSAGSVIVEL